jgi:hypothetical protein
LKRRSPHSDYEFDADQFELRCNCYFFNSNWSLDHQIIA